MDGLGSASPPVAPTATTGEGRHPCTWPRTFWFKPLSAFGLLDLTTFISSSPELAMPSTLAPNRLSASSRRALSREARPPWVGEVTLSQELRTARLPRPHVLVGYQWSHTGLRPGRKTSHKYSVNPPASVQRVPCPRPRPRLAVGSVIGIPRRNLTMRRGYDVSGAGTSSSHPHARLCSGLRFHGRNRSTSSTARPPAWAHASR